MDTREMLIEAGAQRIAALVEELRGICAEQHWPLVCMALVSNGEDSAACLGAVHIDGPASTDLLRGAGPMGEAVYEAAKLFNAGSQLMKAQAHFDEVSRSAPCECPACTLSRTAQGSSN